MKLIQQGRIEAGGVVFSEPVNLPEGTEVLVFIEVIDPSKPVAVGKSAEDLAALPVFGMCADRDDLRDSEAWVRRERERWHQRAARPD